MKRFKLKNKKLKRFIVTLPWAMVLLIPGIMYLSRKLTSVDGIVFFIGGLFILFDSMFTFSKQNIKYKPSNLTLFIIIATTTIGIIISPKYSIQNAIIIILLGILLIPIIISGRSINKKSIESIVPLWFTNRPKLHKALITWAIIIIAFLFWEFLMALLGVGSFKAWYLNPTLTNLIKPLFHNSICYLISIVFWLLFGVYLLRRGKP